MTQDNIDSFDNALMHYGVKRQSGRYPWGSGDNGYQKHVTFLGDVQNYKKQGWSEKDIAEAILGPGASSTQLRALITNSKAEKVRGEFAMIQKLQEKGLSNVAIGQRMGLGESQVRARISSVTKDRADKFDTVKGFLKDQVDTHGYIDVGAGTEHHLQISDTRKKAILTAMEAEGYQKFWLTVEQSTGAGETTVMVMAKPGTKFKDVVENQDKIRPPMGYSEDRGATITTIVKPKAVDPKRIAVRYAEDGGADKDGVIELRRGVDDISLGAARYAQVRIAVEGDRYLKGMVMYSDNLPKGVDILFNTNKSDTGNKFDAMKQLEPDSDMPFGSIVRQKYYTDKDGKRQQSVLNIVGSSKTDDDGNDISYSGEEGNWNTWSKTLSSQMLSKQPVRLAKEQLDSTFRVKNEEYDEIMKLTNPVVRKKLLEEFADGADASAVHLKAAGLPRTRSQVILPINSLKDNEVFAPNYENGERVVLIRHPHGGTFEIPELVVNNRNKEANSVIKQSKDAIGINSRVAARLSGADFDGDTVLVIPNNSGKIKSTQPLAGLRDFEPKMYKLPDDTKIKPMANKQKQMGDISNLITDMTIRGASNNEIARAVRHSMVVIDAQKHNLDYRQSAKDNGISDLKTKYQGRSNAGASTLISLAKSQERVLERKPRKAADGGPVDPETGKKVWEYTDATYTDKNGVVQPKYLKAKSTKMAEADDARKLISEANTPMENVYANHANRLKALANNARKAAVNTKPPRQNESAKKVYADEVSSLKNKLKIAEMNAPLERKAQLIAKTIERQKIQASPNMEEGELKKVRSMAIQEGRARAGANKQRINFTDREWEAVEAGAVAATTLSSILTHANMDDVKARATPRARTVMTDAKMARAQALLANGHNQSDVARALGVPLSTLYDAIN